jgi:hypothetical protein
VTLNGRDLTHATPRQRLRAGFAYVPEDRQEDGLVGDFSVADNMVLDVFDQPPFASGINLNLAAITRHAAERVTEFDVRTTSVETPVGTLSGGNQQKVILARELGREHKLRSSSCTAGSWSSATRATPCSSSRPNSTRSTRSPTGSRSCTRVRSPASGHRTWRCPSSDG